MNDQKDLNKILSGRVVPPASTNLASRIVAAAAMQKETPFSQIILQEILDMIVLPRPAYTLAFTLVLGVFLGVQAYGDWGLTTQEWLLFTDIEEGDWL